MALIFRDQPLHAVSPQDAGLARIAFDTPDILTGIKLGTIPAGAMPQLVQIAVPWVFDNGAYLNMGFAAGGVEWAVNVDLTAAGVVLSATWANITVLPLASDREVWAKILHGGTPPTQGWVSPSILYSY
ncbi:MAG: hypothetical protein R3E02_10015 [Blastomonas sp.]